MRERWLWGAMLCALLGAAGPSFGEPFAPPALEDLMHARDYGMGGAYRAHGLGAEAAFGNPAALGLYPRYQLELSGAWDPTSRFGFGTIAVADSVTSAVAAGLSYHYASLLTADGGRVNTHLTTAGFAIPVASGIFLGASAKHALMSGALEANAASMDAGLLVRFGGFAGSFTGHNLIDVANPLLQRYYALSFAFLGTLLTASAEVRGEIEGAVPKLTYGGGLEYIAANGFPLRVGYSVTPLRDQSWISTGLGIITETGGIDLSYRHELGGLLGRMLALTVRMQIQ